MEVVSVSEWTRPGTAVAMATATAPRTAIIYALTGVRSVCDASASQSNACDASANSCEHSDVFRITPSSGVITLQVGLLFIYILFFINLVV